MPRIPFPEGLEGHENLPRTRRSLTNCFNNLLGQIIPRPGITLIKDTGLAARGNFVWNGSLYQVASNSLIRITNKETGDFVIIGTILGTPNIVSAIGFNDAVIVVKGGQIYTLSKTDVLTTISGNANFVPSDAVAHIDGRFVYIPSNGDPAFFSDVGAAGTVQSTSFFDAEELPDKNNTVFNFKNTLYIGGTDSFELFRDTGASPNPFGRISGARIINGFIGGLIEYNETFLFIGREKDQDFGIYAIGQGLAPKISNEVIDVILSTYTQSELQIAIGGRLKWRGYDIATFTLQRDSFGFFGGNWFRLEGVDNERATIWGGGFIVQFEGEYFTAFKSKFGKFSTLNTDYGDIITRIIDIGFEEPDNDFFSCQSISLGISQGFNDQEIPVVPSSKNTVALFMSRNNVEYSEPLFRNLGDLGEYTQHLEWNYPGGMGSYDGFMGIRIYTTQDVVFSSDHLIANFR